MPRPRRVDEKGGIYHALNRSNARVKIFRKDEDFLAFEKVIAQAQEKFAVELFAYQWMPNHWHMVLSPQVAGEMGRFLSWVSMTHSARYHAHHGTAGQGHLYQGRYKSFPIEGDEHFLTACRYVERNALAAKIVKRAEEWRWGSLWNWCGGDSQVRLADWPVTRLTKWVERVNAPLTENDLALFQHSLARGCPYGSEKWVDKTVKRCGLESTMRPRGRPKKKD